MLDNDETQAEILRLNAAVDEFADRMKARLAETARAGKRGWDGPPDRHRDGILRDVAMDVLTLQAVARKVDLAPALGAEDRARLALDIANRAMMLHFFDEPNLNAEYPAPVDPASPTEAEETDYRKLIPGLATEEDERAANEADAAALRALYKRG